jgi:hypothetical protein
MNRALLIVYILRRSCHCEKWHIRCYSTAHRETIYLPFSVCHFPSHWSDNRTIRSKDRAKDSIMHLRYKRHRHYERKRRLTKYRGKSRPRQAADNLPSKTKCRSETPSSWTRLVLRCTPQVLLQTWVSGPVRPDQAKAFVNHPEAGRIYVQHVCWC